MTARTRNRSPARLLAAATAALLGVAAPPAGEGHAGPGRIHGVLVTSDRVEDVSSLEAIAARLSAIEDPRARAEEIFRLVVKFRHQAAPPREHLETDHVHDPIKIFNTYGYCQCCCATAAVMALGRIAGLRTRGRELLHHTVPEIFHSGAWHMYDPSLINWFLDEDGEVASVDDLAADPRAIPDRDAGGFLDDAGRLPARTHGVADLLVHYSRPDNPVHEQRYTLGHRAVQSLRAGEAVERRWSNRGVYLDHEAPGEWPPPVEVQGAEGSLAWLARYDAGYAMGLIGQGALTWDPDLASGRYRDGILGQRNIAARAEDGRSPSIHLARAGHGECVVPVASAWVLLGGILEARVARARPEDRVGVSISLNHGLDWTPIWTAPGIGDQDVAIDLSPHIVRRYGYLLRLEIEAAGPEGSGFESLSIRHDIQHAQRALPRLGPGANRITVSAPHPEIATKTLEGSLDPASTANASWRDHRPEVRHMEEDRDHRALYLSGAPLGSLTFKVDVPGQVAAVRFGGAFRILDPLGRIRLLVSDDDGRTWRTAEVIHGPVIGTTRFVRFTGVDPAARRVLVRYEFGGRDRHGIGLYTFRIDVDHRDPRGGMRPVRVTWAWSERGRPRTHEMTIREYPTTYAIETQASPLMTSLRIEGL